MGLLVSVTELRMLQETMFFCMLLTVVSNLLNSVKVLFCYEPVNCRSLHFRRVNLMTFIHHILVIVNLLPLFVELHGNYTLMLDFLLIKIVNSARLVKSPFSVNHGPFL